MKIIMCIMFAPVFLVKQVVSVVLCFLLFVLLAITMIFGANGLATKKAVYYFRDWANSYPPADL